MDTSICRRQCNAVRAIAACVVGDDPPTALDRRSRRARRGTATSSPAPIHLPRPMEKPCPIPSFPRDHAERVALFRAELIGAVSRRELDQVSWRLRCVRWLAERYRPPGSATLRYRRLDVRALAVRLPRDGLDALRPDRAPTAAAPAS